MKPVIALAVLTLTLSSCGTDNKQSAQSPVEVRQELMGDFEKLADQSTGLINKEAAQQYISKAVSFADQFPEDTLAALPLYRSAEISRSIGLPKAAIDAYKKIIDRYPSFYKKAESAFMLAFSYDEDLNDLESAREAYTSFIEKYPDHTFADDAQMLLSNLGKSDEEILKELEAQMKAKQAAEAKQ